MEPDAAYDARRDGRYVADVVAGWFTESADFGGGPLKSAGGKDIAIARLDANGQHLWSKRFGDWQNQYATAVATMPGTNRIVSRPPAAAASTLGAGRSWARGRRTSGSRCSSLDLPRRTLDVTHGARVEAELHAVARREPQAPTTRCPAP